MRRFEEADRWRAGEKKATFYQDALRRTKEKAARRAELMHVIKPEDMPWEDCAQGKLKHLINDQMPALTRTVDAYLQEIPPGSRSGKHRHMAEEVVFVLEGRGYDLHWDIEARLTDRYEWDVAEEPRRFDWEAGDIIVIPVNTIHQHFNASPDQPARILCASNNVYKLLDCDDIEQLEPAPEAE